MEEITALVPIHEDRKTRKNKKHKIEKTIVCIIIITCILLSFASTITIRWLYDNFGNLAMEEIIFHMKVPLEGTDSSWIYKYIKDCVIKILLPTIVISFILIYPILKNIKSLKKEIHTSENKITKFISIGITIIIVIISMTKVLNTEDIKEYLKSQLQSSALIEKEYVDPKKAKMEFPEQKRNLIYIFLESMETTYYSKEDGGLSEEDLIPEISKLAKENTNFSNTEKLGGPYVLSGTGWTVGAMTAQTTGIPLKLTIDGNSLGEYSTFLGGAYGIGDVLKENDYKNFLLLGSNSTFGGRKSLFNQHGNYEIWDFESAKSEERVTEKVFWGYEDKKLFEFAKEKILNMAEKEEPFNFTILTVDTHAQHGFVCEDCKEQWDEQYKNVISCSSRQVGAFVEWIQQQDFYDNTTIVIAGDHLTMQKNFFALEQNQQYDKTTVSIIINSAIEAENTKDRKYSTMDLYPTTLAALGVKIEGNKLALGTNLFSNEKTLVEKYGVNYLNSELMKPSRFYNNNILVTK